MGSDKNQKVTSALNEAQSIIEAAERRANELRAQGERAYQEGFDRGYKEGRELALKDAAENAVRMLSDTASISDNLAEQAARIGLAVAQKILGEHFEKNEQEVVSQARSALQDALVGSGATIFAHAKDVEILTQAQQLLDDAAGGVRVSIVANDEIERGGCLIKTDFGEVDTQVKTLVEVIGSRLGIAGKKSK